MSALAASRGTVLLLGANGFIGSRLLRALEAAGFAVICGVRNPAAMRGRRAIAVDFMRDHDEAVWLPRLANVDFVVNAVGILKETPHASFEALHVAASRGTVLLLGANGFIGSRLLRALEAAGFAVICGVRNPAAMRGRRAIAVDFMRDHDEAVWLPRLANVDFVVNAVGILKETPHASFEALHVAAPAALFRASAQARVAKIIQVSALGADDKAQSGYHRSKKRADDALASTSVPYVIVQPSLVFGAGGASAALFTTLAALPLIPLPGDGEQAIQPVHIDDLTDVIVRLLQTREHDGRRIAAVGPRAVTLREYLAVLRRAMGIADAHFVRVPLPLVRAGAAMGERMPGMLLDRESLGMLLRGNIAPASSMEHVLGRPPRAPETFIDRDTARAVAGEARLRWLMPLMRWALAFVWIVTGIVSLGVYPVEESYALLARVGLTGVAAAVALYGAALIDLAFGIGIVLMRRRKWLWRAQMALIAGYTAIISWFLPEFWLHPYGPLTKNVPMLVAILMLHEFDGRDEVMR